MKNYNEIWLELLRQRTPDGHFHLPLSAKPLEDMNNVEIFLLTHSTYRLVTEKENGISYYICK